MRRVERWLAVIGALAVVLIIAGGIAGLLALPNLFSARNRPLPGEARLARMARTWSVPSTARRRVNPITMTPDNMMEARAHFADHCASCHGNDGSGKTEMGQNTYPVAPDLRGRETQDLSDGELFYWIENGVRLTAMPAWGAAGHDEEASWTLVAFIRRLPSLTTEDVAAMEYLNPKSPEEWSEQQAEANFLGGGDAPTPAPMSGHHH